VNWWRSTVRLCLTDLHFTELPCTPNRN